jgi:hypothetical protein
MVVDGASASTTIPMDNAAILYSPFNWGVASGSAKTINAGAYFRVIFSGNTAALTTTTAAFSGPYAQFWTRVDGGPLQQHVTQPGAQTHVVDFGTPVGATAKHLLEVVVKSTTERAERWFTQVRSQCGNQSLGGPDDVLVHTRIKAHLPSPSLLTAGDWRGLHWPLAGRRGHCGVATSQAQGTTSLCRVCCERALLHDSQVDQLTSAACHWF